jgi:hypothetical protein
MTMCLCNIRTLNDKMKIENTQLVVQMTKFFKTIEKTLALLER